MVKSKKKSTLLHHSLVIKLLPEMILASVNIRDEDQKSCIDTIHWKLPKKINPNDINQDLELLTESINGMVSHHKLEGETATIILPHRISPTRVIEIPMNLEITSEKKEFTALTKTNAFDFWKEHDPNLATMKGAEIRSNFLLALPEENASNLLYTIAPTKEIKDYITLFLGGNLYPTSLVSEDQALIRIVESKLSRVERERPFCIFHFCKGNSRLIHVTPESMNMATVDIDELDEVLLDDLPSSTKEIDNEFWREVSSRLSNALKQGVIFLNDETRVEKFDSIYFCTDYDNESVLFDIFRGNFRLANFKSLATHFLLNDYEGSNQEKVKKTIESNGTQFIGHAGCYPIHYTSTPSIPNPLINVPLFNLHPAHKFIESNFLKKPIVYKWLKISAIAIALLLVVNLLAVVIAESNDKTEAVEQSSQKNLTRLKGNNKALEKKISDKKQALINLNKMTAEEKREHLLYFISRRLPINTELNNVLIYEEKFTLQGSANTIASVNNLYEKISKERKIIGLKLITYKKNERKDYFFQITGNLMGEL